MKIAYVFSYLGDGGTEDHAILLAKKAKESGNVPIFIISDYSKTGIKKIKSAKIKIISLPMKSSFNPIAVWRSVIGLKKIIESEKVDVVHCHMLREHSLAIFVKILGGKFVLVRTFHRINQFNWKMKPLMPIYLKYTDSVIAISLMMERLLDKNGWGGKHTLIKNGVAKVDVAKHDKAIGFIGRLSSEKGILNFVQSNIEILRHNKLVIAGDGPDYEKIQKISDDDKLCIELMGSVADKAEFYKKISVLVLPSDHEVMPLVILEAYSCGLPVAAFDIEPLLELVLPANGILVKHPDYAQLGAATVSLLDSANKYYAHNINEYNSRYSSEIMWQATADLYHELYEKRQNVIK